MSDETKRYWFPAKRYGWGWGPPATWQGWAVLILWLAVLIPISPWLALRSVSAIHLVSCGDGYGHYRDCLHQGRTATLALGRLIARQV